MYSREDLKLRVVNFRLENFAYEEIKKLVNNLDDISSDHVNISVWIKKVIYNALRLPIPRRNREKDSKLDLRHVDTSKINNETHKLLVELWKKSYTTTQIMKYLKVNEIPPTTAKVWRKINIQNTLQKIADKHAVKEVELDPIFAEMFEIAKTKAKKNKSKKRKSKPKSKK